MSEKHTVGDIERRLHEVEFFNSLNSACGKAGGSHNIPMDQPITLASLATCLAHNGIRFYHDSDSTSAIRMLAREYLNVDAKLGALANRNFNKIDGDETP